MISINSYSMSGGGDGFNLFLLEVRYRMIGRDWNARVGVAIRYIVLGYSRKGSGKGFIEQLFKVSQSNISLSVWVNCSY